MKLEKDKYKEERKVLNKLILDADKRQDGVAYDYLLKYEAEHYPMPWWKAVICALLGAAGTFLFIGLLMIGCTRPWE